ncbi:MAG: TolC family protein [Novosphingobium sp.]
MMPRKRSGCIVAGWALALGGCVHVAPVPVDLAARATARGAVSLDPAAVASEAGRLAPGVDTAAAGLDRLELFAALLIYDPRIAEARAAIETAWREQRAAAQLRPMTLTLTGEYANDPATSSPWLLGGAIEVPLDRGARRSVPIDRARLAVLAARYAYAETVWSERTAQRRALIDYFAAAARIPLLTELLALRDRQLAALERRRAEGETAGITVYPFQAQRAQSARMLEEARATQARARIAIAGTLGLPAAALDRIGLLWPDFAAPSEARPNIGAADRVRAAAGRADVLRLLTAYDQSEADLRLALAGQYPGIAIAPGYTWERGLVKLPLSVALTLPPLDLNRSAIALAVARRQQAGAAIETALAGADNAIEAALAERRASAASYERQRRAELPPALSGGARADAQLREGAIDRANWAAAKITALEARLAAVDALVRIRQADAALEEAMRRPLEGPELAIAPERLRNPEKLGDLR